MVSEDSTGTAAREVSCAAAAREAVCGVRHTSQNFMQWSGNKRTILCQSEHEGIPPRPKLTHIKKHLKKNGNSLYGPASWTHTKGVYRCDHAIGHLTVGEFTVTGVPLFLFAFLLSSWEMDGKAERRWLGTSPCDDERTIALSKNALRAYELSLIHI